MSDQTRNDFEAWLRDFCKFNNREFIRSQNGEYLNMADEIQWKAYQAATAKAERRLEIAVRALRGVQQNTLTVAIANLIATNALKEIESA